MSKGVLIYAYSGVNDYIRLAEVAARLVNKHLHLPVSIITDESINNKVFDKVIYRKKDINNNQWHNKNRYSAYELSPYEQTLLIDADYFVLNNNLKYLFDTNLEFACYNKFQFISGYTVKDFERLSPVSVPMQWATVLYFTKNKLAESVFSFIELIKNNFDFYSYLYYYDYVKYRNDYSLSIALQALTGYSTNNFTAIPGALIHVGNESNLVKADKDKLYFTHKKDNRQYFTVHKSTNLHFLNKSNLFDNGGLELINSII